MAELIYQGFPISNFDFKPKYITSGHRKQICRLDLCVLKECIFGDNRINKSAKTILVTYDKLYTVKISSNKLRCFNHNLKCIKCDAAGNYLFLEMDNNNSLILSVYYLNDRNSFVEMTLDHITPMSLGGSRNKQNNHQTMCYVCNTFKGNELYNSQ